MIITELSDKTKKKMEEAMLFLKKDLDSISTGRANPSLLDHIRVEAYGSMMPISQLASVSVADSTMIAIQVWDKEMTKPIEKSINNANLGFNPMIDGQMIRIAVPKLSEERRRELVKLAKKYGEERKIAIRNIRRDILDEFKRKEKEEGISQDQIHSFNNIVQKITDEYIEKVDEALAIKEKDLMGN